MSACTAPFLCVVCFVVCDMSEPAPEYGPDFWVKACGGKYLVTSKIGIHWTLAELIYDKYCSPNDAVTRGTCTTFLRRGISTMDASMAYACDAPIGELRTAHLEPILQKALEMRADKRHNWAKAAAEALLPNTQFPPIANVAKVQVVRSA